MKHFLPEISWHSRSSILSVHMQCGGRRGRYKMATAGVEPDVRLWELDFQPSSSDGGGGGVEALQVNFVANLRRGHQRAINVVRFSPDGSRLASGDVERYCVIWHRDESTVPDIFADEDDPDLPPNRENWKVLHRLRTNTEDVADVAWSADGQLLLTASVDKTAVLYNANTGHKLKIVADFRQFANGACFDPRGRLFCIMSNDRELRVYSAEPAGKFKLLRRVARAHVPALEPPAGRAHKENAGAEPTPTAAGVAKERRLFCDDQMPSFVRRPAFTPDGELLIAPAGVVESGAALSYCTYVFARRKIDTPALVIPSPKHPTVAVAVCPLYYALVDGVEENASGLPYRFVFAVMSTETLSVYDTQHLAPLAHVDRIHYAQLSDCAWSADGRVLACASQDGYCSLLRFAAGELGAELQSIPERPASPPVPLDATRTPKVKADKKQAAAMVTASATIEAPPPVAAEADRPTPSTPAAGASKRRRREALAMAKWLGAPTSRTAAAGDCGGGGSDGARSRDSDVVLLESPNKDGAAPSPPPKAETATSAPPDGKERNIAEGAPPAKCDEAKEAEADAPPARKAPRRVQVVTLNAAT